MIHTAAWQRFRETILLRDHYRCQVKGCGVIVAEGRTDPRAAVVDHIKPRDLRPDLAWDEGNLWVICREHHAVFDGIEKRLRPDADAIAKAKREYRATRRSNFDQNGWPVW